MTEIETRVEISLTTPDSIVRARQAGRDAARMLGFGLADQTRLATAISEIARNAIRYGGGGDCKITSARLEKSREITVCVRDNGPGIPDLDKAMIPGFSTGNSLGMGMSGAKRLMDTFEVDTAPGQTRVVMVMRRRGVA